MCAEEILIPASFTAEPTIQITSRYSSLPENKEYFKRRPYEVDSLVLSLLCESALTFSGEAKLLNQMKMGLTENNTCVIF